MACTLLKFYLYSWKFKCDLLLNDLRKQIYLATTFLVYVRMLEMLLFYLCSKEAVLAQTTFDIQSSTFEKMIPYVWEDISLQKIWKASSD